MRLRFAPRAIANLIEIADYFHERNPAAGRRVRSDIYAALEDILLFPAAGRLQNVESVRKFVTRTFAYLLYYRIDEGEDEIVVLSIRHPARRREFEDV
jgi:plasmid stabilization system protein ParE